MPTPATTVSSRIARFVAASPLRDGPFRLFYSGSIGTALGYTMQAAMAAWVMATLTLISALIFLRVPRSANMHSHQAESGAPAE